MDIGSVTPEVVEAVGMAAESWVRLQWVKYFGEVIAGILLVGVCVCGLLKLFSRVEED